jgi:acetate kinase
LTAQSGLCGGRSSGAIDPAATAFLQRSQELALDDLERLLTQRSGVLGLSGLSDSLIEVADEASKGVERCERTLRVFVFQVVKTIGGLVATMGGLDMLVFTGTIGVKATRTRRMICEKLGFFGVEIDPVKNEAPPGSKPKEISTESSKVKVYVTPSDVERTIARDCIELVLDGGAA